MKVLYLGSSANQNSEREGQKSLNKGKAGFGAAI